MMTDEDSKYLNRLFLENYALQIHLILALRRLGLTKEQFFELEGLDSSGAKRNTQAMAAYRAQTEATNQ